MSGNDDRALAYVRVSTVRQVDEGNSIATQIARIKEYAKFRRLKIRSRDIIIDDGVSAGIPLFERDGGGLLLDRVETGMFSHVISVKLDRMFRMTSDTIYTLDYLDAEGISIHFIDYYGQSIDTRNSVGRFFLTVFAAQAEMERGLVSERTKSGMEYLKRNKFKFTRSIYGWNVDSEDNIRPNWREQSRIDYMAWQMQKNIMSATSVAKSMNANKWLGKEGGKWNSTSVARVVNNDFHKERKEFRYPNWWGSKPWHRGGKKRGNVRIPKRGKNELWTKADL